MTQHELLQMWFEIVRQGHWEFRMGQADVVRDRPSESWIQEKQRLGGRARDEIQAKVVRADKRAVDQK